MIRDFKRWAIYGVVLPALVILVLVFWIVPATWGQATASILGDTLGKFFIGYLIFFSLAAAIYKDWIDRHGETQQAKPTPHFRLAVSATLLAGGFLTSLLLFSEAWFLAGIFSGAGTVFAVGSFVEERTRRIWAFLAGAFAILNGAIFTMNVYPQLHYLRAYI